MTGMAENFTRGRAVPSPSVEKPTAGEENGLSTCPDCGSPLHLRVPGFRPLTVEEHRHLTPEAVRVLGLCPNPRCP